MEGVALATPANGARAREESRGYEVLRSAQDNVLALPNRPYSSTSVQPSAFALSQSDTNDHQFRSFLPW